jgi:hypothetical protein
MRRLPLALVAVALVIGALLTSGCGVSGLAFRQDDRLSFVAPRDRSTVTLPITVQWRVEDFHVGEDAGSFAVFVDRAPQPPGEPLAWLARNDDSCRVADGCPDERWYAERDVFRTMDLELTIDRLPARTDDRREWHEVTVVLIDTHGRRVGETGWTVEFQVERER